VVFVLVPGDRIEGYVVDEPLGHGGYATVFRGHDASAPESAVALKVLDEAHRRPPDLARLQREFRFARGIHHRHVVQMYAAGPHWLAMELLTGGTVMRLPFVAARLVALAQIADALDHVHRHGIVHCDVKPSNILVRQTITSATLIDFGAAHSLAEDVGRRPSHVEASLPYSAPELLRGSTPTAAVDEYALACTVVEAITGAPPFMANTTMKLIDDHLSSPPPRVSQKLPWVPHAIDSMVAKAMAKDPDARYESCGEFLRLVTTAMGT
jgi:eukaryotic-like serine/threonine-protein kinase